MITDVYLVCSDSLQREKVKDSVRGSLTFHFLDPLSKEERKEALALKSYWAARLDPFAIVTNEDKPVKAFYSEANDVINDLIEYLNGKDISAG